MSFMSFVGDIFGLATPTSQAFMPQGLRYEAARNQVSQNSQRDTIFSLLKLGTGFADAWQARDYQKQAQRAKNMAYQNAQVLAQAEMESNLKIAQYEADRRIEAAQVLESNLPNLVLAADRTREQGRMMQAQRAGEIKSRYAASGILVGTGSARLVFEDVLRETDKEITNQYQASINEMRDVANAAMKGRLEAQFAVWTAEEQNRFMQVNVNQRLS